MSEPEITRLLDELVLSDSDRSALEEFKAEVRDRALEEVAEEAERWGDCSFAKRIRALRGSK